jgi:hypothetical protein
MLFSLSTDRAQAIDKCRCATMLRAGETTALRNGEIAMEIIVLLVLERDDRSVVYTSSFMAD